MKAKVIQFPYGHFITNKQLNLTPLMVDTLLSACEKQKAQIPFGPRDIKGSFTALVNRGLIIRTEVSHGDKIELPWKVTKKAISMLKFLGVIVAC